MALGNFIKKNFVLAAGLALPVLLVALFFFASVLPRSLATPPQYEMIFTTNHYDYQNPSSYTVDFLVRNGTLTARVVRNDKQAVNYNSRKLMAYDGKTQSVREIPYDISKISGVTDGTEIVFEEFKSMKLSSDSKAPDGYEFDNAGYGSHGLMHEMWGGGYRSRSARVTKGAVAFKIPNNGSGNYYYYDVQFLGWVLQK